MVAKGTTSWDMEEDKKAEADKAAKDKAAKDKKNHDPLDPATEAGNTGNSPTLGPGVKKKPTPEDDEAAKAEAKKAGEDTEEALDQGSYRRATRIESDAIKHGASLLGKEKVVVQDAHGNPVAATRGVPDTAIVNASATNPALVANNAVAAGAEPPKPPEPPAARGGEDGETRDDIKVIVTDLHGQGGIVHAG